MAQELSGDIERAVQDHHGYLEVDGKKSRYVVMSIDVFQETMRISDEELDASLKAIEAGLADVEAGRTKPVDQFFREFDEKNDIRR